MSDILDSLSEHEQERAATMAESNCYSTEAIAQDIRRHLIDCFIRWQKEGTRMANKFFAEYETMHGKDKADKLRAECRAEWDRRKAAA